jgi:enoyl-CoA hydratase
MTLAYEKEGHIVKLGLNRPKEKNALDPDTLMELYHAWLNINKDDDVRVVILYSCLPDIFCSGMDLKTAIPIISRVREPETDAEKWLLQAGNDVGEAMLKPNIVNKPVIAAINGYCITGGFEMVMGADLRIASDDAIFQMREARLGIMPSGGSNIYLPRMVGSCRAMEILLTANNFAAQTLYNWGFLNNVVPRTGLMDTAMEMAQRIADNGPRAVQGMVRCMRETGDMKLGEAFAKELEIGLPIFVSDDVREGIRAQKEKRKPNFI